jgi:indole-3-glycerol phosphate synthase
VTSALASILEYKRVEVAAAKAATPRAAIEASAKAAGPTRGFATALKRTAARDGIALIAEIKKASPSKGVIRADFDPPAHAKAYEQGGAACLSVLTDGPSFMGSMDHLVAARATASLPVLRKEFMIDPWQVAEARAFGADAILIVMAAVDDGTASAIIAAAADWDMDALVEVHDEAELERALALPSRLIGINNRDLATFKTSLEVTERLAKLAPPDRLIVSESGIGAPADVARVKAAGARAILVGESLMRQPDPGEAARRLLSAGERQ